MARLLVPEDFGLVALATVVISFIGLFSELGLTSATVQRSQIDQDTVSGLFFITLGIGCFLVPLVCGLAPLAAWFFNDPRITRLIIALSVTFPLTALGLQHTALLLRSMRWMTLQSAGILGHAAGLAGGIIARANVYSALRNRVATLSSGIIGRAMKRTSSHSGTSADGAK